MSLKHCACRLEVSWPSVRTRAVVTSCRSHWLLLCRLCETSLTEKCAELEGNVHMTRSIGLARSQEPSFPEDQMVGPGTCCHGSAHCEVTTSATDNTSAVCPAGLQVFSGQLEAGRTGGEAHPASGTWGRKRRYTTDTRHHHGGYWFMVKEEEEEGNTLYRPH